MSIRLYVIPMESDGANHRGPKYLPWSRDPDPSDNVDVDSLNAEETQQSHTPWTVLNYGLYNWAVAAVGGAYERQRATANDEWGPWIENPGIDSIVHSNLAGKSDVKQIPADLDTNVGSAGRDDARAFLEAAALPGQWVQNGTQWREVIRTVCGFMLFGQRYDGIRQVAAPGSPSLGSQINGNLSLQWGNIPIGVRNAVVQTGESFGYDMTFIVNTTLVRAILKTLADLWGDQPIFFGLEQFNDGQTFTV